MNCPNCRIQYNSGANIPHLLPKCGHSICSSCLASTFKNSSITCIECKEINNAENLSIFPKNMALITVNKTPVNINSSITPICKIHGKKQEAFCQDDKILLCIDCILLDGHKQHEISAITASYNKANEVLNSYLEKAKSIEEDLKIMLSDIDAKRYDLHEKAKEKNSKITELFLEITNVIHERESNLKNGVAALVEKDEQNLANETHSISKQLKIIKEFKEECVLAFKETETNLLIKYKNLLEFSIQASQNPPPITEMSPFIDLNKEN